MLVEANSHNVSFMGATICTEKLLLQYCNVSITRHDLLTGECTFCFDTLLAWKDLQSHTAETRYATDRSNECIPHGSKKNLAAVLKSRVRMLNNFLQVPKSIDGDRDGFARAELIYNLP